VKTINATLLTHKGQPATTLTDLLLVGPLDDATYRGFTLLDKDVTFTPSVGIGSMTFKARTGFEMSEFQQANDLSVDNAEANTLLPVAGFETEGFTQAQIDSGALDKVRFVVLRVNYNDLTAGRHEVIAAGTIGEVKTKVGGLTVLELRSLAQLLKQQSIVELDSLTCRAIFGSQAIGTGGGVVEQRFPCGYDLTAEWVDGTVTDVGGETDRQFGDDDLIGTSFTENYFAPGLVEFLTGDNAGQQREVDTYDYLSGIIELRFPTVSPMQVGDTYRIRRQCSKNASGHNSCRTFFDTNWNLHFRGEPAIPVGQSDNLSTPGAQVSGGGGSVGNDFSSEAA
jgi:uncharacterized phage protein (TIGR02218 family)